MAARSKAEIEEQELLRKIQQQLRINPNLHAQQPAQQSVPTQPNQYSAPSNARQTTPTNPVTQIQPLSNHYNPYNQLEGTFNAHAPEMSPQGAEYDTELAFLVDKIHVDEKQQQEQAFMPYIF
mmetsp:Transcript_29109/g.32326  ORF Transcript_29109/g.32326 Transcript_29109/m.32326 type:complete len:123 (-) Transcript_29109:298-666(-)